ncbi:hypothetical protein LCGC14_2278660 [marine sediment metagenome]|uniref:Uncharacterized protein n=1 Tax=marine sediment metagenome TaxID=412755 RepID=A0A0F9CV24_9ZZZZ
MPDEAKDHWEGNAAIYVHYGKRYGTSIVDGKVGIGCLGEVQKAADNKHATPEPVSKILVDETDEEVFLKQRGRPKKEDNLSRSTKWRREKESQGILL